MRIPNANIDPVGTVSATVGFSPTAEPPYPYQQPDRSRVYEIGVPVPDSPIFHYGDQAIISRAVVALLRQVRAINQFIEVETGYEIEEQAAFARITEIDGLLKELAAVTERTDEPDLEAEG